MLELTSGRQVANFTERTCYHIGQTLACSQLQGGKAVLLGDAAAAFSPIGPGVNAAMKSAMALDRFVGTTGASAEALRRYNAQWRPEADAVAWMAVRSLFENRAHAPRVHHLAARHQRVRSSKERRNSLLRGPSHSHAAVAAVDMSQKYRQPVSTTRTRSLCPRATMTTPAGTGVLP